MVVSTLIILGLTSVAGITAVDTQSIDEILNHQLCAVCDGEETIDDCDQFVLCNQLEKCYLQVFNHGGKKKYYGGCTNQCTDHRYFTKTVNKRNDILTDNIKPEHHTPICGQCCTGDNCNVHLCGAKDSIESKQMCAICRNTSSLEDCKHFHLCDPGQKCYLQKFTHIHHGRPETKFYAGCSSSCSGNTLIHHGKREDFLTGNQSPNSDHNSQQTCGQCCTGENCNIHLCGSTSNVIFCAACNGVSSVDECLGREECPGDECYMDVLESVFFGTKKVYAGCATKDECISQFGKSKRQFKIFGTSVPLTEHGGLFARTCGKCCHDDNHCNLDVCGISKTTAATPTTTTITNSSGAKSNPTASPNQKQGSTSQPIKSTTSHVIMSTKPPLKCETCSGSTCGIVTGGVVQCKAGSAGCMNTVDVDEKGNVSVTKRCATETECQTKWLQETSSNAMCMNLSWVKINKTPITCHYCCTGDACNSGVIPTSKTLYKGR